MVTLLKTGDARRPTRTIQSLVGIDQLELRRPMDDDLAQAVELSEALVEGGGYISDFVDRLVI